MKAVDGRYPLFGGFRLASGQPLSETIARRGETWGAVAEQRLLDKLDIGVGGTLRVGDATFVITSVIAAPSAMNAREAHAVTRSSARKTGPPRRAAPGENRPAGTGTQSDRDRRSANSRQRVGAG